MLVKKIWSTKKKYEPEKKVGQKNVGLKKCWSKNYWGGKKLSQKKVGYNKKSEKYFKEEKRFVLKFFS